ncbi:hypothetical protein MT418_001181 [Batrachochytrium dendrobatidis]
MYTKATKKLFGLLIAIYVLVHIEFVIGVPLVISLNIFPSDTVSSTAHLSKITESLSSDTTKILSQSESTSTLATDLPKSTTEIVTTTLSSITETTVTDVFTTTTASSIASVIVKDNSDTILNRSSVTSLVQPPKTENEKESAISSVTSLVQPPKTENEKESAISSVTTTRPVSTSKIDVTVKDTTIDDVLSTTAIAGSLVVNSEKFIDTSEPNSSSDSIKPTLKILQALPEQLTIPPTRSSTSFDSQTLAVNLPTTSLSSTILPSSILPDPTITQSSNLSTVDIITTTAIVVPTSDKSERLQEPPSTITSNEIASTSSSTDLPNTIAILNRLSAETVSSTTIFATLLSSDFTTSIQPTATPSRLSPEQLSSLLAGTSISFDPQILIVNLPSINVPATTTTVGSNPPVIQLPPILGLPLPQIPIPTIGPVVLPSIIPGVPPVIPVNLPSIISAIPPVIPTNLPVDIPGVPPVPLPVPPVPRATPTLPIVIPGLPPIVVPPVDNTITASAPTATPSRLSPEQLSSLLAGTSISFDPQILIVNLPSINVPATTTTVGSNPPVIQLPPILGLPLPQIPIPTIGPVVLPSIIPGVPPVIPINLPSIISAIPSVIPVNLPSIISAIPPVIPTNLPVDIPGLPSVIPVNLPSIISAIPPVIPTNLPVDIPGVPPVPLPAPPVPRATPTLPIVISGLPPIVVPPVDNTITASAPTATPSRLSPEQLSSLLAGTSISFDPQILIVNLPSINVPATTTTVGSNPPVIQLPPILGLPLPQIPIPTIGPVVLPSIIPGVPPVIPINLPSIISAIPSVIPTNLPVDIPGLPPVIPTNLPVDIPGLPSVIPVNLPSIISAIPPVIPTNLPVDIPGVPPVPLPVPPVPRATPTLPIVIPGLPPIVVPPVDNTITASAPTATPSRLSPEQLSSLLAGTSISFDPQILIVNLPSINVPATTTTVGSNPPVIQLPPILGLPLPQIPIPTIGPVVLPSIIPGVPPVIPINLPSIISAIPSVIPVNLPSIISAIPPVIPTNLPVDIPGLPSVIPVNLPSIISAIPPVIPTNLPVDIPGVPPVPLPAPQVPRATPTLPIVIPGLPPIVVPPVDNTITASAPTATPSRLSPEQLSSLLAGTSISFDPQILIVNLPSINVPATTTTVGSNPPVIQLPPILGLPLPQIPIPTIGPVVLPSIIPGVPPVIPVNLPSIISAIPSVIPINLPSIISAIPPVIPTNLPVDIPGVPPVPLPVPPVPRATPTLPIVIPGLPPIVVPPVDNTITASAPTATPSRLSPEQLSSLLAGTSISFDPQILIVNLPSINVPATTTTVGSNPPVIQLPPILGLPLPQIPIPTIGPVVLPSIIPGVPPVIPINLPSIISAIPSVIPVNLPSIISAIPPVIPTNLPVDIPGVPPVPLPVPPVPRATPTLPIVIPGLPPIVVPPVDNTITASAPTATPSRLSPEQLSSLLAGTSISFDPQILIVNLPSINVPATTTTVGSNPPVIQLPPILGLPLPQIPIPTIGPVVLPSIIPGVPPVIPINLPSIISAIPSVIPINLPSIISAIPPVIPTNLPIDIPGVPPVIPVNLPSIISAIPPVIPTNLPVDIPGVPPVIPVNLPSIIPVVSVLNIPTIRKTSLLTPTEIAQPASTEPFLPAAPLPAPLPVSKFSESFSSQQVDGGNSIPASIPTSVNGDITVPNQSQFPGQFNIPVQQPNSVQFQSTAAAEATIIFGSGVSNVPAVAPDATVNPVKDGSIITASGSIPIPPAQHASHDEVVIQDSNASQIVSPTLAPVVNIVANNPGGAVIVGGKQSNPIPSAQPGDIVGNSGPTRNNGPTSDSNTTTPPSNNNGMSATTLEMIFGGIGAGLVVLGSVLVVTRRSQLSLPNASSGLSASENGAASTLALPIAIVGPVLKSGKDAAEGVVVRPESHRSTLPPLLKLSNSKTKSFSIFSTESLFSGLSLSTIAFANQTEATDIESPVEKKANTLFSIDMHDDNHQASTHTNYGSGESMPEKSLTSYIHPSALSGSSLYSDIDAVEPVAMPNIASNTSPFVAVPIDNEISFTFGCGMSSIDRVSDLTVTTISTNPWRRQSDMEAISTLQRNNSVCSGVHITDTMDSWRISHISKAPTLNETTEFDPDKTFSGKYQYVTHGITETQRERISFENNSNVLAEKALDKHTESYFDIDQETGEDKSSWFDEQSSGALSGAGIFSQPKHTVANCNPSSHENLDKFSLADYVQDPSPRLGYIPREYKPRPILRDSDYDEHTQSNGEWTINDTTVTGFDYSLHNQSRRSSITFASQSMEFH